ncbi:dienelactone hydrolase family protein [Acinetobacter sp. 479375]|uniref:Alpha/beta fold hydrolase n=1 Tax=Acinetobacter ursingii TaxID=108980 RepID=A0A7T9UL29_9GAMM|nr:MULTISPECIES: alpha/beta fold hydrolase [Acinetobacter]EXD35657.1 dienelactone hydrolase family protein [Acinetobacter sp. 479375]QQT87846.1 alpha/beta fold hydrolase [Acinetobacter ursingii]RSO83937.1 alpha/beta hydrolase [Acinetobacter ursingii]
MVQKNLNDSQQPADIEFQSGDLKCRAYLYRPDQSTASPIIVMAHGLGGTRKMRLTAFAERFVKEGYACLVFDYRYFGDSDGKPRQLLDIQCQLEDWKAAIRYARSLPNIDASHIVRWGSSFSGGHVLATAAQDANICAVISQCPFTDGLASSMAVNPITSSKLTALAIRDRIGATLGQKTVMVKLAGHPNETALMTAPDAYAGILSLTQDIPDYKNYVAARFALDIIRYYPGRKTSKIKAPVLFCICENDTVAPAKTTLRHANRTPQKEIKTYSYGHFEIYTGDAFEHVVKDQIDFLKRHVPVHYA